jgi:hypothetical protein
MENMKDFIGTKEQLCNALEHIANRKSSNFTDVSVCAAARDTILYLEDLLGRYACRVVEAEGVYFQPEGPEGDYIIDLSLHCNP